ncbi:salivary protein Tsal2A-like isoform X2 [Anoplolepis gracilipes]|uniref:salivary protein Tsal2A-like isoform X2 n=1 Tax=Anoplolepis gracilipes TaxID=354296 RepID=UPI003BA0C1AE
MLAVIALLSYISSVIVYNADADCAISTKYNMGDLKEPQPLLLKQTVKNATIWYPDDDNGTLSISTDNSIYLACPGKDNYLKNRSWGNEAKAICVKDKVFDVNEARHNFSFLVCKSHPQHYAKYMDSPPCLDRHSPIEIGFNVSGTFIRTIELCRDDKTYTTYYTKFKMSKMIGSYQRSYPRPSRFLTGGFYPGIDMDYLYKFETQLNTLARILNSTKLAQERLKRSVQFLSRGHMAAKADFIYGALQRATFWYLNTAPQWQSFNGGNWNSLEDSVRRFAASRRLDLDVYTGVHGQMTMEDIRGKQQPVHLYAEGAIVPAPKFYWKVIYDPLSKRGTAFVGLNDPFVKSVTDDIYLCMDISEKIKWLNWRPRNITAGISYACSIADLRKTVPMVPVLDVISILI